MLRKNKNILIYLGLIIGTIMLIHFNILNWAIIVLYIILGLGFSVFLYRSIFANAGKYLDIQEGLHKVKSDKVLYKDKVKRIRITIFRILISIKYGIGFPFLLISGMLDNQFENQERNWAYNSLYPSENTFLIVLFGASVFISYLNWFGSIENYFFIKTIYFLIAFLVCLHLISELIIPNFNIKAYKISLHNPKIQILIFGIVSYFVLAICLLGLVNIGVLPDFEQIKDFNSNFLGFKKIRLYFYEVSQELFLKDIILAAIGFLVSLTAISSIKKIFQSKRDDLDYIEISNNLALIGEYTEAEKWIGFVDNDNEQHFKYWRVYGFIKIGKKEYAEAFKKYEKSLTQESSDPYSFDYAFMRLIAESLGYYVSEQNKKDMLFLWFSNSQEKTFIAYFIILSLDEELVEHVRELNNEKTSRKDRKNLERALNFKTELEPESDLEKYFLVGNSPVIHYLNAFMRCFQILINEESKDLEFDEPFEIMKGIIDEHPHKSLHYLFFLSTFILKISTKQFRSDLEEKVKTFYKYNLEALRKYNRVELLDLVEIEDEVIELFDSTIE